jgi:hypothetical protein
LPNIGFDPSLRLLSNQIIYAEALVICCREVPILVHSLEGVNLRIFLNLRRMHEYGNLPLCKQLYFDFLASFPFCK